MSAGMRGAGAGQDARFSNKDKKLLRTMQFPEELRIPVDMAKVDLEAMRPWVAERVTGLLNFEDDVLVGLVFNLLEEKEFDPRMMQIQLTPFLEGSTAQFMIELWKLLVSAQKTASGIPEEFIRAKAEEIERKKEVQEEMDRRFRELRRGDVGGDGTRGDSRSYDQSHNRGESRGSRRRSPSPSRSRHSYHRDSRARHESYRDRDRGRDRDRVGRGVSHRNGRSPERSHQHRHRDDHPRQHRHRDGSSPSRYRRARRSPSEDSQESRRRHRRDRRERERQRRRSRSRSDSY